jgi:hypothetical protein
MLMFKTFSKLGKRQNVMRRSWSYISIALTVLCVGTAEAHMLLTGKFLDVGQTRSDALLGAQRWIERSHGATPSHG